MSRYVPSSLSAVHCQDLYPLAHYSVPTLVDNVPVRTLPLVPAHDLLDVVLHDAHQSGIVVDLVYPVWKLTIPHQGMASHLLLILRREIGNGVCIAPAKRSAVWFGGVPLHSILRRDGAKLSALDEILLRVI